MKNAATPTLYTNHDGYIFRYPSENDDQECYVVKVTRPSGDLTFRLYACNMGDELELVTMQQLDEIVKHYAENGHDYDMKASGSVDLMDNHGHVSWMLDDSKRRFDAMSLIVNIAF